MRAELSLRELVQRTGEPLERLQQWHSLGLIGRAGSEEFGPEDVERVRLLQFLLRRLASVEAITRTDQQDGFLARYIEQMFPAGVRPTYSFSKAAEILGLDLDTLRRFSEAAGLNEQGESLDEEDVQALRAFKVALDAGFPEGALVQLGRVYADALARVAEAEVRLSHFYVHDRLKAQGLSGQELTETSRASGDRATPLIEPLLLYFHRKGFRRALREDALLHVQEGAGVPEKAAVVGQLRVAIVFVDLSSFTSLAEAMGDHAAAQVLERFSQLVRDAVQRGEGRVVKQIGDAFMLVFPESRSAVACALEIERRATAEPHFPALRSGVHCGQVLYREGDYLGTNVNVAARLAAEAPPHQVLVTAAARKEAGGLPDVEFVPLGKRRLKGLTEEVELFEVVPIVQGKVARLIDPVCGMELNTDEVAARLSLEGEERVFCSQECLQRFVAAPERYGRRPGGRSRMPRQERLPP
jgi:adenylate cyclase